MQATHCQFADTKWRMVWMSKWPWQAQIGHKKWEWSCHYNSFRFILEMHTGAHYAQVEWTSDTESFSSKQGDHQETWFLLNFKHMWQVTLVPEASARQMLLTPNIMIQWSSDWLFQPRRCLHECLNWVRSIIAHVGSERQYHGWRIKKKLMMREHKMPGRN